MLLVSVGWPCDKAGCDSQKFQVSAELPVIRGWNSSACYVAHGLSVKLVPVYLIQLDK